MVELIKEQLLQDDNILVRMFKNNAYKDHPITVQAIDDSCGERIETVLCIDMQQAEKHYNKYVFADAVPVSETTFVELLADDRKQQNLHTEEKAVSEIEGSQFTLF